MPILASEPSIFPEFLLDEPPALEDRSWRVVYTKPNQEKALARELLQFEIPFYLPQIVKENWFRGRSRCSFVPIFGGYVFLMTNEEERVQALTTNRIKQILPVTDQVELRDDLCNVRDLIDSGAPLTIESRLEKGDRVRIRAGSLAGLEGAVIRRERKSRLLISVRYLGSGISVEIDDHMVEPI